MVVVGGKLVEECLLFPIGMSNEEYLSWMALLDSYRNRTGADIFHIELESYCCL